ncbi:MAG: phosphoglucosamine mutase [Myxococcales bacterium]|nr:phosphoglucosamine mutase [Myxococcales bacterium]
MSRQLFGTDGIRGKANVYPMVPEVALKLGMSIAYTFRQAKHRSRFLIGKDTRLSCYMFEQALAAGICAMGGEALLVGPLPSPAIAFLTRDMRADAGAVISASHNPFNDNGIKFFDSEGYKLPDELELQLEELVLGDQLATFAAGDAEIGRTRRIEDAAGRYIVFLKRSFPRELSLEGLRVVVDCANGAAYKVAPTVFYELGADVEPLGVSPNGLNINHENGAVSPAAMARRVKEVGAHIGVALDGDADRCILVDESGSVVDGDELMAIVASHRLQHGSLVKNTVVATLMSNLGLDIAVERHGGQVVKTAVGDRYVIAEMLRGGYEFGGEQSGHLIFHDLTSTGDGILSALQVLAVMLREQKPLSELRRVMERLPQVLVNLKVRDKPPLETLTKVNGCIARIEGALGRTGRVVVRYSGTEAKVRIMLEGPDQSRIESFADEIADAFRNEIGL